MLKKKTNASVLIEVMWLMKMKIRLKIKSRSQRYDINRPTPWHR